MMWRCTGLYFCVRSWDGLWRQDAISIPLVLYLVRLMYFSWGVPRVHYFDVRFCLLSLELRFRRLV